MYSQRAPSPLSPARRRTPGGRASSAQPDPAYPGGRGPKGSLLAGLVILTAAGSGLEGQEPPPTNLPAADGTAVPMVFAQESVFAVVTHRGGLAGGLAHNHFVTASEYLADFVYDASDPSRSALRFSTLVEDLVVDDPDQQATWIDRIRALDVVDDFGNLSEGDRTKIRREMLDEDQLDPDNHPLIAALLTGLAEQPRRVGSVDFTHVATVDVTVHGTTVTREVPLRYDVEDDGLRIEAVGHFEFEEFGIEPYSAFLGTVKVQNEFQIYLNLKAIPPPATP